MGYVGHMQLFFEIFICLATLWGAKQQFNKILLNITITQVK
jgi:hypothetical protein